MSLGFVLGRAGAGKTTWCLRAIAEEARLRPEGPPLVFLVPEQATLVMEQALCAEAAKAAAGEGALGRVTVTGFRRLARRVLAEAGLRGEPVSRLGCRMALRGFLERRRAELRFFAPVVERAGAAARVEAALAELRAWGLGARELGELAGALEETRTGHRLARKLHDLALLARDLEEWLGERLLEPDGVLAAAARVLERGGLAGARVWVDGFSDFTRPEAELLVRLAGVADVWVALCLDPALAAGGEVGEAAPGPFAEVAATYAALLRRARAAGVPLREPVLLDRRPPPRFAAAPALAALEEALAGNGRAAGDAAEPPVRGRASVCLVEAADRRTEVEAAAREILRLAREEGLRFREIGCLTRDLSRYADAVQSVFPSFGIPFFLDRRRPAVHHPLVRLVRSALAAVRDWSREAVLAYLKNDLQPVSAATVDLIENAALVRWAHGAEAWLTPWPGLPAHLAHLERARRGLVGPLAAMWRSLDWGRAGLTAARVGRAVWELLEDLRVPARLAARADAAQRAGHPGEAADHLQAWEGVVRVLEEYVEHLGDTVLPLAQQVEVLDAALAGLELATPPPALDQVVVGSVDRSRSHGLAAILLLGAVEGEFPGVPEEDAVLDDADRRRLADLGFPVGPTSGELERREAYLVYVALTRAARRLWISWPRLDERGRRVEPSRLVRDVAAFVPEGHLERAAAGHEVSPADCACRREVVVRLACLLRDASAGLSPDPRWRALYEVVRARPALAGALADLRSFPSTPVPQAGEGGGAATAGEPRVLFVTELEDMAACPFRHFLAHVAKARPRPEARPDPRALGELYHRALAALGRAALAHPGGLAGLTDEELETLVAREVDAAMNGGVACLAGLSPGLRRLVAGRARQNLLSAALALREWARRSAFRVWAAELPFGPVPREEGGPAGEESDAAWDGGSAGAGRGLPALRLRLPDGGEALVGGRIDRLDRGSVEGRDYLLVVEYKRRARSPRRQLVRPGLELQLPLYALAALETAAGGAALAGALFFAVEPELRRGRREAAGERALHRARGFVLAEGAVVRAVDAAAGQGRSVLAVRWRKDGKPWGQAGLVEDGELAALLEEARSAAAELAAAVSRGEAARRPARNGAESACDPCVYRPVCPFDPLLGDAYRVVGAPGPSEAGVREEVGS